MRWKAVSNKTTNPKRVTVEGKDIGPQAFTIGAIQVDEKGFPVGDGRVDVDVEYRGGRYVAKAVKVSTLPGTETPVTADLLRTVSVEELVREGVGAEIRLYEDVFSSPPDISAGPTDENLRMLAVIYRRAYALGDPPTKTVVETMGLNRNTAARWVMKARERGFLPKTEERKPKA